MAWSKESRDAAARRMKKQWADPEWRERWAKARRGVNLARSEAMKKRWDDPSFRERWRAARWGVKADSAIMQNSVAIGAHEVIHLEPSSAPQIGFFRSLGRGIGAMLGLSR